MLPDLRSEGLLQLQTSNHDSDQNTSLRRRTIVCECGSAAMLCRLTSQPGLITISYQTRYDWIKYASDKWSITCNLNTVTMVIPNISAKLRKKNCCLFIVSDLSWPTCITFMGHTWENADLESCLRCTTLSGLVFRPSCAHDLGTYVVSLMRSILSIICSTNWSSLCKRFHSVLVP